MKLTDCLLGRYNLLAKDHCSSKEIIGLRVRSEYIGHQHVGIKNLTYNSNTICEIYMY